MSPGHQHPWYWQFRIGYFLSYSRKDFSYLCHVNVEELYKMWICVFVPSEKFSTQGVNLYKPNIHLHLHQTDPNVLPHIMLSGRFYEDEAVWRWATGEILPRDAPVWDTGEPNGDSPPRITFLSRHRNGVNDITDDKYDSRPICESGNIYQAFFMKIPFTRVLFPLCVSQLIMKYVSLHIKITFTHVERQLRLIFQSYMNKIISHQVIIS